jgi:hypothetical protein
MTSRPRPSTRLIDAALTVAFAFVLIAMHARWDHRAPAGVEVRARIAARLGLTDLCLFTEARYTRHLSQTDRFTPFQDHPLALEHFPSGSLLAIPDSLREAP